MISPHHGWQGPKWFGSRLPLSLLTHPPAPALCPQTHQVSFYLRAFAPAVPCQAAHCTAPMSPDPADHQSKEDPHYSTSFLSPSLICFIANDFCLKVSDLFVSSFVLSCPKLEYKLYKSECFLEPAQYCTLNAKNRAGHISYNQYILIILTVITLL